MRVYRSVGISFKHILFWPYADTDPSSGSVILQVHQRACIAHSPLLCVNEHPGKLTPPSHIVTTPSPLEPAEPVSAFSVLPRVTPTLDQLTLAARTCNGVGDARRRYGIHERCLSAPYQKIKQLLVL